MAMTSRPKRGVPEGLWIRCPQCKATVFRKEAESRFNVCPECHYHFYVPAQERIKQLLDEESFEEWFTDLRPRDPLEFKDRILYGERLKAEQAKTGMADAAVVGKGFIRGRPVVFGVTDFAFMAGSMGSVVGEKLTRATEEATRLKLPLIFVSGSGGGARMQEGILSLMQMAKISAALGRFDTAKRFELLGRTGQGSMSKVWRARDRNLGRTVCLKILDKEKTAKFEARFPGLNRPHEGIICAGLKHKNIVQTYEFGYTMQGEM